MVQFSCRHNQTHTNEPYWLVYNITPFFYWSNILFLYLYLLVRAVDHGNEHVEKNYHHSDIIDSVQHVADVLYELMVILQHHRNHFRQPEDWPEESLETLLYPAGTERDVVAVRKSAHASDYTHKSSMRYQLIAVSVTHMQTHEMHFNVVGFMRWHWWNTWWVMSNLNTLLPHLDLSHTQTHTNTITYKYTHMALYHTKQHIEKAGKGSAPQFERSVYKSLFIKFSA